MYMPGYTTINDNFSPNGFNFNYFELAIASVVDPYFDLFVVLQFTDGEFGIEEAFLKTRSLPAGFKLKAGKFFSGFGRLNAQHDHVWNFSDQPLVYHAIFGTLNLNDLGFQLNWVAPADIYISMGIEILQGQNQDSFSFLNEDMQIGEKLIEKSSAPLFVSFIKTSIDIDDLIILGGLSYATGKINKYYEDVNYGLSGNSRVFGIDLTLKYLIDSYRYINLQSEFIYRNMEGNRLTEFDNQNFKNSHYGFYSELVWRYTRRWRCGVRYDSVVGKDNLYLDFNKKIPGNLYRYSAMLEFNPSEFSRIRLQYNYSKSRILDDEIKDFHEFFVNFNLAIGAHGAHKF